MALSIESPAFQANAPIPAVYTADGEDRSPPLRWSGVPAEAKTLTLIVEDPDAPSGTFVHWIAFNIPATLDHISEGTEHRGDYTDGTLQGMNGFDRVGYSGPKPPQGQTHRYVFAVKVHVHADDHDPVDEDVGLAGHQLAGRCTKRSISCTF